MLRSRALLLLLLLLPSPAFARREKLELRYQALELPGAPSSILPADVDGDGRIDLAVVVASTRWDQISIEESAKMDDVEGLVEVLTVIPALIDRRELRVFRGRPGGFEPQGVSLALDPSILAIEAGPPGMPVVALTDTGLSVLRVQGSEIAWEPVLAERSILAGTGTFLPGLNLVRDLDGDGRADLLLPTRDGASIYLSGPEGLRASPASRVRFPVDGLQPPGSSPLLLHYPLPEVGDLDGNGLPDLMLRPSQGGLYGFRVLRNLGGGRFSEAVAPLGETVKASRIGEGDTEGPEPVWFGDLDGDGKAEYVTQEDKGPGENAGFRKEMQHAKRPVFLYRLHRARPDLSMEPRPYQQFEAEGYSVGGGSDDGEIRLPGGFQDLNGDGHMDLVAMTLDFSMFQVAKVLTVRRLGIDLDFHVWCQAGGAFRPVRGIDLSGKFNLNLNNLKIGHLSQFAGDFDGDGRPEFVQMGKGKAVTIHRGHPDCSYAAQPDLAIQLQEPPRDLSLIQVRDFDGDRLADLVVIQPQAPKRGDDRGVTPPVRLDLYMSGGGL
jgi:FG-GAP-like repeat